MNFGCIQRAGCIVWVIYQRQSTKFPSAENLSLLLSSSTRARSVRPLYARASRALPLLFELFSKKQHWLFFFLLSSLSQTQSSQLREGREAETLVMYHPKNTRSVLPQNEVLATSWSWCENPSKWPLNLGIGSTFLNRIRAVRVIPGSKDAKSFKICDHLLCANFEYVLVFVIDAFKRLLATFNVFGFFPKSLAHLSFRWKKETFLKLSLFRWLSKMILALPALSTLSYFL